MDTDAEKITRETYDRIAEDWHRDHVNDWMLIAGMDAFIDLLGQETLVLDAGCGGGMKSEYLLQHGISIIGIDYSRAMIEIARRNVPKARFLVMDMKEAGKLKENFDGISVQASLLHIPKAQALDVLRLLTNKLKPGGYMYVAVKEPRPGEVDEEMKKENDYGYEYERFLSYYILDEIKQYFTLLNLTVCYKNRKQYDKTCWIQVIGKK